MWISARQIVLGFASLGLLLAHASSLAAAEDPRAFLNALREKGYADTALTYLQLLEKQGKVPAELQETLDLEKSDCYRVASKHAYSPEQAQKFLALAKEHLEKFVKAHPNHPAGAHALLTEADSALEAALQKLSLAKQESGDTKNTAMKNAREALLAVRGRYAAVREQYAKFIEEFAKSPLPTKGKLSAADQQIKAERERTELGFVESLLKEGLINYQVGQTFTDPKSAEKKKILQEAIKLFDLCFRKYSAQSDIGLQANHWKAKSLQELGDYVTATDIYDEILVMEPTTGKPSDATATFYAQVALDRIKTLRQQNKQEFAREDLESWLEDHKTWTKTAGYQGMALEFVRLLIAEGEKNPAEKTKLTQQAQVLLSNIIKVESEFKSEAILLRRQLTPGDGKAPTTIDEALALAESAAAAENWNDAKQGFEQALTLATNPKDAKKREEATQRLHQVKLQIAWKTFQEGKADDAMAAARELMNLGKNDPVAASSAGLAITIAYQEYNKDRKNEAAKTKLQEIAKTIIELWPQKAEADEARVILGQQQLEAGDYSASYKLLNAVSAESKRYGPTQLLIGQMFWKRYIEEKKQKGEEFDSQAPSNFRSGAIKAFETAVKALEEQHQAEQPLSETAIEARQILTQALLEAQQPAAACAAVKPLVDSWSKHPPDKVDLAMLRTANAAVKANLLNGDAAEAGKVVTLLIDLGPDTTEVNSALIEFARAIRRETSATLEAQQAAKSAVDYKTVATIDKKLEGLRTIEAKMLENLVKRQNYSLGGMLYLAETLNTIGKSMESKSFYKTILDRAEKDPEFRKTAEKMLTRIRAQVIGLLTSEGKYDEALKQVDLLIESHPKALEPKVEKARILTAHAKHAPKVERYNAAVNEWSGIRVALQRMPQKPPEYYESIMNVADSLITLSDLSKDPQKALQAEQLLATTLKLSPKLNGPETVLQFEKTLQNAVNVQKKYAKSR